MLAPEQFTEQQPADPASRAALLDEVFGANDPESQKQSLKLIQNFPDGDPRNQPGCLIYLDQNKGEERVFEGGENNTIKYTVKEGDNLWSIINEAFKQKDGEEPAAWKTLAALRKIAETNALNNPDLIHAGEVLDFTVIDEVNFDQEAENGATSPAGGRPEGGGSPNTADGDSDDPERTNLSAVDKPEGSDGAAQARRNPTERNKWYISQAGDGANWYACGPTSLLMALSDNGVMDATEGNRQKLISATGTNPGVGFPGTSSTMADVARRNGLKAESKDTTDWKEVDAQLQQGRGVIVNGTMVGKSGGLIKHFVYISGKDASGNYILGDPAQPGKERWSQADLAGFMSRGGPPNGYAAVWR